MKYYFITYQGQRRDNDPSISIWQDVIDISPMEFLDELLKDENSPDTKSYYNDFYILNTCEISRKDYYKYKDAF